ncbi:hypothetical protein [Cognatishimia sp. MH4019]|uniref:hypothetical protein n=1 Tax=Cognatishimia sp. MH4019 TaxID=2854030 RepID=UPI001CD2E2F4|nr:hypothetical protein [Cognatishimia sp. MH4019]
MSSYPTPLPGQALYSAIMSALRNRTITLEAWCRESGVPSEAARRCMFGLNGGPVSKDRLNKLIDYAGRDVVLENYHRELLRQAEEFKRWAA